MKLKRLVLKVLLQCLAYILVVGCGSEKAPQEEAVNYSAPLPYAETDQKFFWNTIANQTLSSILSRDLPYPEINKAVADQDILIRQRFGNKKVIFHLDTTYHPVSRSILGGSGLDDAKNPAVTLHVPALMDQYGLLQLKGEEQCFETTFIKIVLHELYHLSEFPIVPPTQIDPEVEVHIHALTTKNVTAILTETYGVRLCLDGLDEYRVWVASNRDETSPVWREYIFAKHLRIEN